MTDTVVPFARPSAAVCEADETDVPHITGAARCLACHHEWLGVSPVATTGLECPSCGCERGAWKYDLIPSGGLVWRCNCGNDLFHLTPTGAMCLSCGCFPEEWARDLAP